MVLTFLSSTLHGLPRRPASGKSLEGSWKRFTQLSLGLPFEGSAVFHFAGNPFGRSAIYFPNTEEGSFSREALRRKREALIKKVILISSEHLLAKQTAPGRIDATCVRLLTPALPQGHNGGKSGIGAAHTTLERDMVAV